MRGDRPELKHVRRDSSSKHPIGVLPSPNLLIQLPRCTGVEYITSGCFQSAFGVTGPRICVSVYILRRYEWGGVWLLVGSPTGMEVVVLGGHVIVGLCKQWVAPPGLATWSRIKMVVDMPMYVFGMYVCYRSLGMSKNMFG